MASEWAWDLAGELLRSDYEGTVNQDAVADALDAAREEGAQCERWECHLTTVEGADDPEVGDDAREVVYWLAARIAARGPMRKKEAKRG